jgi:predicted metal-dependent peptidase
LRRIDVMGLTDGQLITKLKYNFGEKFPYLAGLCNNIEVRLTDKPIITPSGGETVAYCCDTSITINKEFLGQNFQVALGVFAHEVLHIGLMHTARYTKYKEQGVGDEWAGAYNVLADLRINSLLKNEGMSLPEGIVDSSNVNSVLEMSGFKINKGASKQMKDMVEVINSDDLQSTDKAFNMLRAFYTYDGKDGPGRGSGKGGKGNKFNGTDIGKGDKSSKEQEEDVKQKIVSGLVGSQEKGSGSGNLRRLFEKAYYSKQIDYANLIKQSLAKEMQKVLDYNQPHKKSIELDFAPYMPKWSDKSSRYHVAIAIDNSGSMSGDTINKICGELFRLIERYPVSFDVYVCDDEITQTFLDIKKLADLKKVKEITGCGGTSFQPVFKKIKQLKELKGSKRRNYKTLVYFTDGYGDQDQCEEVKDLKVWWVVDDQGQKLTFPFGKVCMVS